MTGLWFVKGLLISMMLFLAIFLSKVTYDFFILKDYSGFGRKIPRPPKPKEVFKKKKKSKKK